MTDAKTKLVVRSKGEVEMLHDDCYMMKMGNDVACFYIDPVGRADVCASTMSDFGTPIVFLCGPEDGEPTEIEFPSFPGFRFFASSGGKTVAISLIKDER